jgi:hypothetical protein
MDSYIYIHIYSYIHVSFIWLLEAGKYGQNMQYSLILILLLF